MLGSERVVAGTLLEVRRWEGGQDVRNTEIRQWLRFLPAVCSWVSHPTSLSISFLSNYQD